MPKPITERELPEYLMAAMTRLEEEAYRAGQHGCCREGAANPSCFDACEKHGPRSRAALSLLCHALAEYAEGIVGEAAREVGNQPDHAVLDGLGYAPIEAATQRIRALAPPCPRCGGVGFVPGPEHFCACSRGKAFKHWARIDADRPAPVPAPSSREGGDEG